MPTGGNSSKLLRFGGSERECLGLPGLPEPRGFRPPAQGGLSPLPPSSGPPGPRPPRSRDGPGPVPRLRPARRVRGASAAVLRGSAAGKSWLRAPRPPRGGAPGLPGKVAEAPGVLAGVEGPCGRTRLLCSLRKLSRNGTNSFRRGRSALRAATSELSWGRSRGREAKGSADSPGRQPLRPQGGRPGSGAQRSALGAGRQPGPAGRRD